MGRRQLPAIQNGLEGMPLGTTDGGWRTLEVYVAPDCDGCETARRLVAEVVGRALPHLRVRLVDLGEPGAVRAPAVFAVPTYLLDGRVLSLGNPELDWLLARLDGSAETGGGRLRGRR